MKLYGYWRSGPAYRVRIALNIKGVAYEQESVHLVRDGGEHLKPAYRAINPQARVPALVTDDGTVLTQSPAILEWIEDMWPSPALLPADPLGRHRVRALASIIACDIHPLNNIAPLNYLKQHFGAEADAVKAWIAHWVLEAFPAVEQMIDGRHGFCFGNTPTLADVAIIPQIYSARRFSVPLDAFPKILAVEAACNALEPFQRAAPEAQPDAEPPGKPRAGQPRG